MKKVLLGLVLLVSTLSYGQVDVIKINSRGEILAMKINSEIKTISFKRENLNLMLTIESEKYNSKMSTTYTIVQSYTTTVRGQKCTRMDVKDKQGLKSSFIFSHESRKVYLLEDGYEIHYSGLGVKYE
jgi:hypothetical protein